jgi:cell division inhibitor SepF
MSFADVWNRTLVYFGIAEEDDEWDEDGYLTEEDLASSYRERPNVRRLTPRRRQQQDFDDWTDPEPEETAASTPRCRLREPARARTASSERCRRCRCTS